MTPQDQARIRVFIKEFPWLTRFISENNITGVKVSRISQEVLDFIPEMKSDGEDGYYQEFIFLVNKDGNKLAQVGYIPPMPDPTFRWWKCWKWLGRMGNNFRETPSEALVRLGEYSAEVAFIVRFGWAAYSTAGLNQPREVTVYKSPKGFTLKRWAEQVQQRAKNALKQQLDAIDQDAEKMLAEEIATAETPSE